MNVPYLSREVILGTRDRGVPVRVQRFGMGHGTAVLYPDGTVRTDFKPDGEPLPGHSRRCTHVLEEDRS